jgi:hypothetical protein
MALEYEALRAELATNRQFIFERPVLILGVSLAGLLGIEQSPAAPLEQLGLLFVVSLFFQSVLFFNLWFTLNRLRSSSRILAYLVVVHEGPRRRSWRGWETSLLDYRRWRLDHREEARKIEKNHLDGEQYDSRRYYGPIFSFHCVLSGLASIAIAVLAIARIPPGPVRLAVLGFALLLVSAFVAIAGWQWQPRRVRNAIEAEVEIWKKVLAQRGRPKGLARVGAPAQAPAAGGQ